MTTTFPTLFGLPAVSDPAQWSLGLWLTLGMLGAALLAGASVRVVPKHQRIVISRLGRTSRVRGPGLVFSLPVVETATEVSLRTVHLPLTVSAVTRDGVPVRLIATVSSRITSPARSTSFSADPVGDTAAATEHALAKRVAATELSALLLVREQWEEWLPDEITAVATEWGAEVLDVTVRDIETRLSAELLRVTGRHTTDRAM